MSRPRAQRKDFQYFKPIEVRWGDMDALGHVNNAQYFVYSESARIAYLAELFADDPSFMNGQGPILAQISCDYHAQVHYPAQLDVGIGITRLGRSSLVLACPIFHQGQDSAIAEVSATLVWFDYQAQASIAVPQRLRAQFQPGGN